MGQIRLPGQIGLLGQIDLFKQLGLVSEVGSCEDEEVLGATVAQIGLMG